MFTISLRQLVGFSAVLTMTAAPGFAQSGTPKAAPGYTLSVFAKSVPGKYTKPDSIAVLEDHIYIGYGDGNDPAGADGKSNMIVEYNRKGQSIYSFAVKGHNDGLKLNPYTRKLWVMQNEDANPSLVIFDPETRTKKTYTFAAAPAAGGGYDDITFRNGKTYLSASNPQKNPNAAPAIVEAQLVGSQVEVTPVLAGDAMATNILTGTSAKLNLQDPDSMTTTPSGDLLLDSQGDPELVVVRKPGAKSQSAVVVPLSSPYGQPQVDDTVFTPSMDGFILVTDTAGDTTYVIKKRSLHREWRIRLELRGRLLLLDSSANSTLSSES